MKLQVFLTVFTTVFLAELGDKTQLATVLFASDASHNRWFVFLAAASALVAAAALGVLFGSALSSVIDLRLLNAAAGIGFVLIGLWLLYSTFA